MKDIAKQKQRNWKVVIGSTVNIPNVEAIVKKVFAHLINPDTVSNQISLECSEKLGTDWSYNKKSEIARKTVEGLKVSTKDDKTIVEIAFDIDFPVKDFTRPFVVDWVLNDGICEVSKTTLIESIEARINSTDGKLSDELTADWAQQNQVAKQIFANLKVISVK